MQALGDRVIVKPITEEKTASGIILSTPKETTDGIVISVGDKAPVVKAGDKVRYIPNSGIQVEHEKEQYRILRITEILFIHGNIS